MPPGDAWAKATNGGTVPAGNTTAANGDNDERTFMVTCFNGFITGDGKQRLDMVANGRNSHSLRTAR